MTQDTRQLGPQGWRALEAVELLAEEPTRELQKKAQTCLQTLTASCPSMKNEGVIPLCLQFLLLTELGVTV